jgi:hypothetical protein
MEAGLDGQAQSGLSTSSSQPPVVSQWRDLDKAQTAVNGEGFVKKLRDSESHCSESRTDQQTKGSGSIDGTAHAQLATTPS